MRKLTTLLIATMLVFTAQAGELEKIKREGKIVLAVRDESPPFTYVHEKQTMGYSIDLCNKVVEAIKKEIQNPNLKTEYLVVQSSERIPSIVQGKASLECGVTTNNKERRQTVAFSVPHFFSSVKFLVLTSSGIKDTDQLINENIITLKGSTAVALLNTFKSQKLGKMQIVEVENRDQAIEFLKEGKGKAYVTDDVLLYAMKARSPKEFEVIGKSLNIEPYSIMMKKDDWEFKKLVDQEIIRTMQSGEFTQIYNKWFLQPTPPDNINMNLPMSIMLRETIKYPSDKVGDNY